MRSAGGGSAERRRDEHGTVPPLETGRPVGTHPCVAGSRGRDAESVRLPTLARTQPVRTDPAAKHIRLSKPDDAVPGDAG